MPRCHVGEPEIARTRAELRPRGPGPEASASAERLLPSAAGRRDAAGA